MAVACVSGSEWWRQPHPALSEMSVILDLARKKGGFNIFLKSHPVRYAIFINKLRGISMRNLFLFLSLFFLAGCADAILDRKEGEVLDQLPPSGGELQPARVTTLAEASSVASRLATAYFEAAREAQNTQDAASAALIVTAATVVSGSIKGTSDTALANRGLAAVGLQQAATRGVNRTTIESLYDAAQVLNCISVVASIYENDPALGADQVAAAEVVTGVIREVRVNTRKGFTRDVADYSSILGAFQAVITGEDNTEVVGANILRAEDATTATPQQLEVFLTRLGGCVAAKQLSSSNSEQEESQ